MTPEFRPGTRGAAPGTERSLFALIREFGADAALLLRQEIELARAEVRQIATRAAGASAKVAVGAGIGAMGTMTLLAAVVILVGELIGSYWQAAIIVAAVLLALGGWLAFAGTRRVRSMTPRSSAASLQATGQWARAEASKVSTAIRGGGRRPLIADGGRDVARTVTGKAGPGRQPPSRKLGMAAFLKHVGAEISEDEVPGHAAKLAYYSFMAMPPALMALFGLAGLVGSERFAAWLQEQAALALPAAVSENIIGPFIEQVVLQKAPGPFSIGLILALWGGSSIFLGLMDTLNHAYDAEETRSFVKKRAIALVIMIGSLLLFLVAAGSLLAGPAIVAAFGLGPAGELAWTILQWPLAFSFMVGAFWCAYFFLPDRNQSGRAGVLLRSAALAAALWVLATAAFRIYIANFGSYSETYGFLGAFIILLLWLYVTGLVVLAGGELASEMEKRVA